MKKYEPAITVVSLTLLFAVLALLVTGAFIRQPEPKEGMVREKDDEMQIYNGRDWIDVFEQPKPAAFDEPNEPECKTVIGMYSEGGKRMVPGEPFDITIGPIDNIPEEWIIRFADPNEVSK